MSIGLGTRIGHYHLEAARGVGPGCGGGLGCALELLTDELPLPELADDELPLEELLELGGGGGPDEPDDELLEDELPEPLLEEDELDPTT